MTGGRRSAGQVSRESETKPLRSSAFRSSACSQHQTLMKMLHCAFVIIVSAVIVLHGANAQLSDGDACSMSNGGPGECKRINKCPYVHKQLLSGKQPDTLCGFSGFDPIVCCPQAAEPALPPIIATKEPPTQRPVTQAPVNTPSRGQFSTESPNESKNPGDLARRKCAEYGKSVYALVDNPVWTPTAQRVNISQCAVTTKKLIVGGVKADPKEFPHMTAVGFRSEGTIVWLCGGTLVSANFVLTAAHCTYNSFYRAAVRVRVGDLNLERTNDIARPQERDIIERIRHPDYKQPLEYNDIALLKLAKQVDFDAFVRPACLSTSLRDEGDKAIATGWGRVDWTDDEGSSDLLKVTLTTVQQSECNSTFIGGSIDYKLNRGIVDELQICAGGNGTDTCQGDSGGPLVIYDPNVTCMYNVVGVTSLGRLCGSIAPGVYTRVSNYISWLENIIWRS